MRFGNRLPIKKKQITGKRKTAVFISRFLDTFYFTNSNLPSLAIEPLFPLAFSSA